MNFRFRMKRSSLVAVSALFFFHHSVQASPKAGDAIPGQFIVTLSEDTDPAEFAKEHNLNPRFFYKGNFKGFAGSLSELRHRGLMKDRRVLTVEQDRVITIDALQSGATWGISRIDQRALPVDSDYNYNYAGRGVNVYVIDTGIRYTHQEFEGRAVFGFDAFKGDGSDCHSHGTHVAGTVGGKTFGVAKKTKLIAVRVLDCNGSGTLSSVIAGLDWVRLNHKSPAVANLSLGGGASATLDAALSNMITSGVTTVVAAGNENADACTKSPARVAAAITVGASDSRDTRAYFSNFGNCVDLFAPGVGIVSANQANNTDSLSMSGTSMATPHVAGAAALILEKHPRDNPQQVTDRLVALSTKSAVFDSNSLNNNLLYSVEPLDTVRPSVKITSPLTGSVVTSGSTVTIASTATDDVAVRKVEVRVNGVLKCTMTAAPYNCNWSVPAGAGVTYDLQAKATDSTGNMRWSALVRVTSK